METHAARTTAFRLSNNSSGAFSLSKVTLGDNAKFRGREPRPGESDLPPFSVVVWEIEWSGDKPTTPPKPTVLEWSGNGSLRVSVKEGQRPEVSAERVQAEVKQDSRTNGFEITLR